MRFQTGVGTSSVHMTFHFGCISKRPNILIDMRRHSISGSAYMILYHPKRNFISVKMTDMKSIPALTFKRTSALIATSNESALIHFALGKLCLHENLMPVWNSFWSKWPIWSPYRFEFHFTSAHVKTSKELTEHWSEIFNRNEIPYRFEFILPLMWTYSKCD